MYKPPVYNICLAFNPLDFTPLLPRNMLAVSAHIFLSDVWLKTLI